MQRSALRTKAGPDTVRNLEIWRRSIQLVAQIYRISGTWPKEELFGLTSQARRAAVSVPANIAEGVGRGTPAEVVRFCRIAVASLYEIDTLFEIAQRLGVARREHASEVRTAATGLVLGITAFIRHQHDRID